MNHNIAHYSKEHLHKKVTFENSVCEDHFGMGEKIYFSNAICKARQKKIYKIVLTTTMFHKNQNQTGGVISLVSHVSYIEDWFIIYFLQEISPLFLKNHYFEIQNPSQKTFFKWWCGIPLQ